MNISTQLSALAIGLAAVVGASVAVSLGHIDTATYIAVVSSFGGVGVGAGIHAAGVNTTPAGQATSPSPPQTIPTA